MDRAADVLLSDGSTVHMRQIGPADADAIVALHSRFSDRTRYLRYFAPYPRIPARDLARFVNVDHRDREALVVSSGGQLVAVGRYERLGTDADDAEVAFVVEDTYQGRGIGSVLLEHLAAAARDAGIRRFVAEVLPENGGMLRVFAEAGYTVARRYGDGVVHLTFPIEPTDRSIAVRHRRELTAEARSIARLLAPRTVAVYGGGRFGAALRRNLSTFAGTVHLDGDLAVVAVPADAVLGAVDDAAAQGATAVVVVSAGFAEAGPEGARLQDELLRRCRAAGLRLVGPNCLGIANTDPAVRLNATLSPELPPHGRVGFFSQSGALGVALLDTARRRGLGLSTFVSAGNRADVSGNDLLQYWQDDPATDVVLLYLESFGNPRKFSRLARRLSRDKPIVAVAPALPQWAGARAAPAGQRLPAGVLRVDTVTELFDVGLLLAYQPLPAGHRVGVVTNSSVLGALASAAGPPSGLTVTRRTDLPPGTSPSSFARALRTIAADDTVDALVVACVPLLSASTGFGAVLAEPLGKPVVATVLAEDVPPGVPAYPSVEEAVRALGRVAAYAAWRREPAGTIPDVSTVDSDDLLERYGIRVVASRIVDPPGAVAAARELGFPVAVKLADPERRHRPDLGTVRLDLPDADAVARTVAELTALFGPERLIVQPMVPAGVPFVVEAVDDPAYGPLVGFGPGGVVGDLLGDKAWRAAPLTDRDAAALVREPRTAPLLFGYRGAPEADVAALEDLVLRVGVLVDEHPEVTRLVLNPVLVGPTGVSIVDSTVHYGQPTGRDDEGPRRLR
jgi:acyl-CoA synthetase (NDP forming)/GNAT superfamily N-acetyltransferase